MALENLTLALVRLGQGLCSFAHEKNHSPAIAASTYPLAFRPNEVMDVVDYLRNSEQALYDFNTPWSMTIVVLGFLSAWVVTNVLEHLGVTRHVWHLPLFFAAIAVIFGSLIGLFFAP